MKRTLYIIEEHHEVFRVWHKERIGEHRPAVLIHVDAHPDMSLPQKGTIPGHDDPQDTVAEFIRTDLDLQTFITPAVFNGWFDRVIWIKPGQEKPAGSNIRVWKTKGSDDRLFMGKQMPACGVGKTFRYQWTGLGHACTIGPGPCVLDIDLDFFAGSTAPAVGTIEITAEEYDRYALDSRHCIRLHFGSRARIESRDGRHHLILTPDDMVHRAGIRDIKEKEALGTIEALGRWLTQSRIDPEWITLCRSRISGFSSPELGQTLEKELIRMLDSVLGPLSPNDL